MPHSAVIFLENVQIHFDTIVTFAIWDLTVIWQLEIKFRLNYVIFQNYSILKIKWLSQTWHNGRDLHVLIFQKTIRKLSSAFFLTHMFPVFILVPSPQAIFILFSKLRPSSIQSHSTPLHTNLLRGSTITQEVFFCFLNKLKYEKSVLKQVWILNYVRNSETE